MMNGRTDWSRHGPSQCHLLRDEENEDEVLMHAVGEGGNAREEVRHDGPATRTEACGWSPDSHRANTQLSPDSYPAVA